MQLPPNVNVAATRQTNAECSKEDHILMRPTVPIVPDMCYIRLLARSPTVRLCVGFGYLLGTKNG